MCQACRRGETFHDLLEMAYIDEMFGRRRGGRSAYADPWDMGMDSDGVNRSGFAAVSDRAMGALDNAKTIFRQHLLTVDLSAGAPVTSEIINFHLVPDMRKAFNRYVKEYGCTAVSRQLTRAEQDLVNKTRKSLLWYTSVTVTPDAQRIYFEKNPHLGRSSAEKAATAGSASGRSSTATTASSSRSVSLSAPLQANWDKKINSKLNEAAIQHKRSHKKKI